MPLYTAFKDRTNLPYTPPQPETHVVAQVNDWGYGFISRHIPVAGQPITATINGVAATIVTTVPSAGQIRIWYADANKTAFWEFNSADVGKTVTITQYTGQGSTFSASLLNEAFAIINELKAWKDAGNTAPTAPTIAYVSKTTSSITIQLTAASTDIEDGTISTYDVYKDTLLHATISLTVGQQYTITGLLAATAYTITLRAKDSVGISSAASNSIVQTTASNSAPTIPSGLASSGITTSGFTLSWAASTDAQSDPITYKVYKNGVLYQSGITTNSLAITGQTPSSNATWTVSATDGALESAQSSGLSVTTTAPAVDLYNAGNEYAATTGGWTGGAFIAGLSPTFTKNAGHLFVKGGGDASNGSVGHFATGTAIDLTNYTKLFVEWEVPVATNGGSDFRVNTDKVSGFAVRVRSSDLMGGSVPMSRRVSEINVSALNGNYYVGVGTTGSIGNVAEVLVYRIWGE